jgi:hypothetical protein
MKNAVIFHGTGDTPNSFWLPWLANQLKQRGFTTSSPQLPEADIPDLQKWLPVALQQTYTPETVIVGHSAGGPLVLSVLENINLRIKQAILVSGYARRKGEKKEEEKILQVKYNWAKISSNVEEIIFINSDNDPWGCNDIEGRYMLDSLGKGKQIIMKNEGHMGSNKFNQPYKKFPLLLKLIE